MLVRFDEHLAKSGYLAMVGQIVDATIVAAPKQRNADGEKADIEAGSILREIVTLSAMMVATSGALGIIVYTQASVI